MNLYLIFIAVLCLIGIKLFIKDFNKDYLNKDCTSCIKGIFILIVFYSHLVGYTKILPEKDFLMLGLRNFLGQLMVTLFLFYSGYGIYESIKNKKGYVKSIPINRILKTLINFDIAVFLFLIINIILEREYPIKNIILSFVGWEGIGNSNWYIFGILIMYLTTYISFLIFNKQKKKAIKLNWLLSIIFIMFMALYKEDYWFNTLLCYPLGITYSYYKKTIEKYCFDSKKYWLIFAITLVSFMVLHKYSNINYIYYEIYAMIFCIVVILITMKIKINNKYLKWFGDNLFGLYILQRIPMLILKSIGYTNHSYRFALIAFISTIILTIIFNFITKKISLLIDKKLLKREL